MHIIFIVFPLDKYGLVTLDLRNIRTWYLTLVSPRQQIQHPLFALWTHFNCFPLKFGATCNPLIKFDVLHIPLRHISIQITAYDKMSAVNLVQCSSCMLYFCNLSTDQKIERRIITSVPHLCKIVTAGIL